SNLRLATGNGEEPSFFCRAKSPREFWKIYIVDLPDCTTCAARQLNLKLGLSLNIIAAITTLLELRDNTCVRWKCLWENIWKWVQWE
ncbi:MAG: hypothetical protein JW999_04920, partial [Methanotrichaceae archaeon]|nr:hypothetical protein [Methanotrichaceae archaeon]